MKKHYLDFLAALCGLLFILFIPIVFILIWYPTILMLKVFLTDIVGIVFILILERVETREKTN